MKNLDSMVLATVLLGGAAATSWVQQELAVGGYVALAVAVSVTAERHASAWWKELLSQIEGRDVGALSQSMLQSAIASRSKLLALHVPISEPMRPFSGTAPVSVHDYVRRSCSGYVLGVFVLSASVLLLLGLGFGGQQEGRLFARLLATRWGAAGVHMGTVFLCCWSLSFLLFSRHTYFGGRK
jgi:hypothetical protein